MEKLTEEKANHPIKFIENQNSSWRNYGEMTTRKCIELFNIDYTDDFEEGKFGTFIAGTLYTDNYKEAKKKLGDWEIEDIKPLSELNNINLLLFKEFKADLDDYYERLQSGNWENIENNTNVLDKVAFW
jgi:hypothetical protein